jgi:putative FmdB family regulatory protein|tara:strand:+ start:170 stop:361 length:192 start_codon:yes stop_codon:yes gene_type:complete
MIYEYKCKDCKLEFTEMRKMKDREKPIECYSCGGEGKVMISTPMFRTSGGGHGKGAGWKGEWK